MKKKLNDDQVREIMASDDAYKVLSRRYSCSVNVISNLRTGQSYRHLTRPLYREKNGYVGPQARVWKDPFSVEEIAKLKMGERK